jgi:hypothetical protein
MLAAEKTRPCIDGGTLLCQMVRSALTMKGMKTAATPAAMIHVGSARPVAKSRSPQRNDKLQ